MIEEILLKNGPAWVICFSLMSMIWKITKELLAVVKNNTSALSKFTEIVSHCQKEEKK